MRRQPDQPNDHAVETWCVDGILEIRLNRPAARNAIDKDLGTSLLSAVVRAANNEAVRVIVLSGAGPGFCSGDDLPAVEAAFTQDPHLGPMLPGTYDPVYLRVAQELLRARKPVIAALHGACVGAGTELACAADLRIAADDLKIGSGLVKVGHLGTAVLLPRVIGLAQATEIYLSGRLLPAAEALSIGLVSRVVPSGDLDSQVSELARTLAAAPTRTIGLYKELRDRAWGEQPEFGLRLQAQYHEVCGRGVADAALGVRAFLERRPPRFTGR